jgi:hypothetical protein
MREKTIDLEKIALRGNPEKDGKQRRRERRKKERQLKKIKP